MALVYTSRYTLTQHTHVCMYIRDNIRKSEYGCVCVQVLVRIQYVGSDTRLTNTLSGPGHRFQLF